uniref:(northern house mosquito) hypothetical protein n=1 Tax=Culex pipiens TaxID=7175 RepID=A0A8D8FB64_CULPI
MGWCTIRNRSRSIWKRANDTRGACAASPSHSPCATEHTSWCSTKLRSSRCDSRWRKPALTGYATVSTPKTVPSATALTRVKTSNQRLESEGFLEKSVEIF